MDPLEFRRRGRVFPSMLVSTGEEAGDGTAAANGSAPPNGKERLRVSEDPLCSARGVDFELDAR